MAYLLQAAQMIEHSPSDVAELFIASRLGGDWMHGFGTLPDSAALPDIVRRAAVIKHQRRAAMEGNPNLLPERVRQLGA
jgi:hypothetical protein